jgi:hypothetical protein
LNSDASAGNWYSPQHEYDEPPNETNVYAKVDQYDHKPGFLYYWSEEEKALLQDMTFRLNGVDIDEGDYDWSGKVWLPTETQMLGGTNDTVAEGTQFSKFTDKNSRKKTMHVKWLNNNNLNSKLTEKDFCSYRMSSATSSTGFTVLMASTGDRSSTTAAIGSYGIAPCIKLPRG